MRENQWTTLLTEHLILRPYLKSHIPKYHDWMQDSWLLEMTATEPMTEEEELEAQRDWIDDPKKLTFIVFDRAVAEGQAPGSAAGMCGDANLFFLEDEAPGCRAAEVMVMIAEPSYRRKGYAREAVLALMGYAVRHHGLAVSSFTAKISEDNAASLSLFRNKLGYSHHRDVPAFQEVHLKRRVRTADGGQAGQSGTSSEAGEQAGPDTAVPDLSKPAQGEEPTFTAEIASIGLQAAAFDNPELGRGS